MAGFDDIEVVSASARFGVTAADNPGGTGFNGGSADSFEGLELVDYDEIVDRNETLHLLQAAHRLEGFVNSTATEDGTLRVAAEVSASPARSDVSDTFTGTNAIGGSDVSGEVANDDSIDLVGRPLSATSYQPFSDTTNGVGGGAGMAFDQYEITAFPEPVARFHPRDELFVNGQMRQWNISDAGTHGVVTVQHVYGVESE